VSGYTSTLLDGIAVLLDGAGVGVFRPDDVIQDPDTGIFRGVLPDSPEKALGITAYPVADDDTTNTITGVQIRMRAGRDPERDRRPRGRSCSTNSTTAASTGSAVSTSPSPGGSHRHGSARTRRSAWS
jgi:hypothetical protein